MVRGLGPPQINAAGLDPWSLRGEREMKNTVRRTGFIAVAFLAAVVSPAFSQNAAPPAEVIEVAKPIRIDLFQWHRTDDDHGIASFVITNNSDQSLSTVELSCWVDGDTTHSKSIKVRARARPIGTHSLQQFSDVDLGFLGPARTAQCEVAGAE